jgi:hypothetical protein|tara:strand:- start:1390 stop:1623 length:234 start_codon:yes stop_codon:yes gene_type:complete
VIISVSDLGLIDFDQVLETSISTVRKSIDETLTFVKYEGDMPSSVAACTTKSQEYSHSEILAILNANDGVWWVEESE